ncbi:hypothetical protein Tco_0897615 [Tanacetum coccineum]
MELFNTTFNRVGNGDTPLSNCLDHRDYMSEDGEWEYIVCDKLASSYSAFDHDHDILVESRSWILQLVSEPRGSRSRILQDGSYWSRTITIGTGLDSYWFYNVHPGHHGYYWSYHVPPGSMTLVSPVLRQFRDSSSVTKRNGGGSTCVCDSPATVQGHNSNDFVTNGVSLNAMGGRKTAVATVM